MDHSKTLLVEENGAILIVTLNRPDVKNAINSHMMRELHDLWQGLIDHPGSLRCIILTGNDTAFCAGADLKERMHISLETWCSQHLWLEGAMRYMVECPIPIIAAVNGPAFGGGLELVLASDFAYAATTATFAQSEVKVGLMPGAMGTQNLPRACGLRRAKELIFTGDTFSAEEAMDWGIVNKLIAPEQLMAETLKVAERICNSAPSPVRKAKKSINLSHHLEINDGFDFELMLYRDLLPTKDREEGIKAFNEKRKPQFTGK